jgi:hypothetical protein
MFGADGQFQKNAKNIKSHYVTLLNKLNAGRHFVLAAAPHILRDCRFDGGQQSEYLERTIGPFMFAFSLDRTRRCSLFRPKLWNASIRNMDGSHSDKMQSHSDNMQSSSPDDNSSIAKESTVKLPSYTELKARVQHSKDLHVIDKLGRKVAKMQGQKTMLLQQMAQQKEALEVLEWQTAVQNKLLSSRHRSLIRQGPSTRPARHRGHLARSDTKHPGKFVAAKKAMSTRKIQK